MYSTYLKLQGKLCYFKQLALALIKILVISPAFFFNLVGYAKNIYNSHRSFILIFLVT